MRFDRDGRPDRDELLRDEDPERAIRALVEQWRALLEA
jgi:hypothetical protein